MDQLAQIEELTITFLQAMDLSLTPTVTEREDQYRVELEGPDAELMLERKASALESLQYILGKVASRRLGLEKRLVLDCGGYRLGRERELEQIAHLAAEKVRRLGDPIDLAPMNPYERRIVHLALRDEQGVESASQGEGFLKRVRISPV